jgi:hypothetical protein
MTIRILTNKKTQRRNLPVVTISYKLKRLTLNQYAVELMINKFGKPLEYGQILIDDEKEGIFWLRAAEGDQEGVNRFDTPSQRTRSLHIGNLLREFQWKLTETVRFRATWDDEVRGLRVDTSERLDGPLS